MEADAQKFAAQAKLDMDKAELDSRTKIEIAHINAEKDLLIAGLAAPPELHAGGMNGAEMPEMPSEEPEGQMMPPEAEMALGGPEMPPEGPMPPQEGMDMGMMPPDMPQ